MRSEFEKLPEIAEKLKYIRFEDGFYFRKYDDADLDEYFVNGAWHVLQEQQKKIDAANALKNYLNGLVDGFLCCDFMAIKTDCVEFINGLKELLK